MWSEWLTIRQSAALLQAIKDYENNKWKTIGARVGKPAKVRPVVLPGLPTLSASNLNPASFDLLTISHPCNATVL